MTKLSAFREASGDTLAQLRHPNDGRPWESAYPEALRGYRLDQDALPVGLDLLAGEVRASHGSREAFTLVLPNGSSASLSFADIDMLSDAFAGYLVNYLGLLPGAVVAVQLPNSLHYPVAVFGAWKAGAVLTNVNPLYTERELVEQLKDSGASVLVATSLSTAALPAALTECHVHIVLAATSDFFSQPAAQAIRAGMTALPDSLSCDTFEEALRLGKDSGAVPRSRYPVALYQYTGGTTGRSKGAQLTHRNVFSAVRMTGDFVAAYGAPFTAGADTMLSVLPLYHIFAFVINFLVMFRAGVRNILVPSPRPLANLSPAFEKFSPNWMTGVDTLYAGLMAEQWFQENPPKLKFAISGGTALRAATAERWRRLVCPILEGYGMTETSCIISFNPPLREQRQPGSVGLPMPGMDVKIEGPAGECMDIGTRGELLVRGPNVTSGYLHHAEENALAFSDGWLRTGDVAVIDPDGYVTIVDRVKDMVLVSGFNVYPNEVEDVIAGHPEVAEVAVVGMPNEVTGEEVCAHVVARQPSLTSADIITHCRIHLTAYKVPKRVIFHDQLPKSPVGKILRAQLRAGK